MCAASRRRSSFRRADRALAAVRRDDTTPEARLVQPNTGLSYRIAAFEGILEWHRIWLVNWTFHRARRDENHSRDRIVVAHKAGEDRLVPAGSGPDEVDERNLELVRRAEGPVVGLVYIAGSIGVQEAVSDDLVVVGRL